MNINGSSSQPIGPQPNIPGSEPPSKPPSKSPSKFKRLIKKIGQKLSQGLSAVGLKKPIKAKHLSKSSPNVEATASRVQAHMKEDQLTENLDKLDDYLTHLKNQKEPLDREQLGFLSRVGFKVEARLEGRLGGRKREALQDALKKIDAIFKHSPKDLSTKDKASKVSIGSYPFPEADHAYSYGDIPRQNSSGYGDIPRTPKNEPNKPISAPPEHVTDYGSTPQAPEEKSSGGYGDIPRTPENEPYEPISMASEELADQEVSGAKMPYNADNSELVNYYLVRPDKLESFIADFDGAEAKIPNSNIAQLLEDLKQGIVESGKPDLQSLLPKIDNALERGIIQQDKPRF